MNIEIVKSGDHYRADCKDLPGSPPVGIGRTPELAMACLMWEILFGKVNATTRRWADYIYEETPIVVNGEKWVYPESYKDA